MLRSDFGKLFLALFGVSLWYGPASASPDDKMVWVSSQAEGAGVAYLSRQVPETDNVQVSASCGANNPEKASAFRVSIATGDLKNGNQTRLRFSGGGKEFEFSGRALVPSDGEGFQGVEVVIPDADPLWDAFNSNESLRYQIPGYPSEELPLAEGRDTISKYVATCRTLAANTASPGGTSNGGSDAKEAFAAAKELNTADGYQAFINAYPTGFYTDLAKAHLKKLQDGSGAGQAAAPSSTEPLSTYTVGPGDTPWFKTTYNGNSNAAGVLSGGLELIAFCTPKREVGLTVRESANSNYPKFKERIRQGLQQDPTADLKFEGEGSFRAKFQSNNADEFNLSYPVATSNGIVRSLLGGDTLHLSRPPFAAIFQLDGSRATICSILNSCGANTPECDSDDDDAQADASDDDERCSSRSVYIEGRGCILKKYVNDRDSNSKKGCGGGKIRVDGKCIRRSEAASFCGPGYRVRGGKCVHQNDIPKKKNSGGQMLKRNGGGFISVGECKSKGMVPEFGYCVEND